MASIARTGENSAEPISGSINDASNWGIHFSGLHFSLPVSSKLNSVGTKTTAITPNDKKPRHLRTPASATALDRHFFYFLHPVGGWTLKIRTAALGTGIAACDQERANAHSGAQQRTRESI